MTTLTARTPMPMSARIALAGKVVRLPAAVRIAEPRISNEPMSARKQRMLRVAMKGIG